jgi:ribosome-associated protein
MPGFRITDTIEIDESELEESFVLSTGPGGQNVNKVSSAVQLRFNAAFSRSLTEPVRFRLMTAAGARLTKDGVIVISARKFRDQGRNRADARAQLAAMIRAAAVEPKFRRKTRPPCAVKEKRLDFKKSRARLKADRAKPALD